VEKGCITSWFTSFGLWHEETKENEKETQNNKEKEVTACLNVNKQ
jgi:hypothetical protein